MGNAVWSNLILFLFHTISMIYGINLPIKVGISRILKVKHGLKDLYKKEHIYQVVA